MTAEHFEEIVMTLIFTYRINKRYIAGRLGVAPKTISRWLRDGVPDTSMPYVSLKLKEIIRGNEK